MKIGIIGMGHMGKALAEGFLDEFEVFVTRRKIDKIKLKSENIKVKNTKREVVENSDIIILATPHTTYEEILKESSDIKAGKIFVSVAPQIGVESLKKLHDKFVIIIPNTPVSIHKGLMGLTNVNLENEELEKIKNLFSHLGDVMELTEEETMLVSVVGGCLPAFFYTFIEAASDGAVLRGMERNMAYEVLARTIKGCTEVMLSDIENVGNLKGKSTTPGGLTIKGVRALEEGGFRAAIINAIEKSR